MFLWLSELLRDEFSPLNVLRYVTFRTLGAMATSLVITLVFYPGFIRMLQSKQIGQVVRDDGPTTHFSKAGTPTMGGTLLIIAMTVSVLLWANLKNLFIWCTLALTIVYGILGFMDDYLKIAKRNTKGVSGKQKLLVQFGAAGLLFGLFFAGVFGDTGFDTRLYLPFLKTPFVVLPAAVYALFATFTVAAMSNAVNLTDGLDGLAIGPVIVASGTFMVLAYLTGARFGSFDVSHYLLLPSVPGVQELAVMCAAVVGAGVGFLWYNTFPALIFMGDVGALALGGTLGCIAVFSKNELLSVIIGGVFVVEAVSVIAQTASFRLTGKRVFAMAPIHHHFEKKGWPEPRVTVRFWIISIMLALVALSSLKLR